MNRKGKDIYPDFQGIGYSKIGYFKEVRTKIKELEKLNYNDFKDESLLDKFGFFGKSLSIGFEYGIYEGEFFEN